MNDLKPLDADDLIQRYGGVVKSMANKIILNSHVVDQQDLEQAGMMALVAVAESYDASSGCSLGAYTRKCVRNALIAEANKCCGVFTIDPRVRSQVNQIIRLRRQGSSDEEIMAHFGMGHRKFVTLTMLIDMQTTGVDEITTDDYSVDNIESVMSALREAGLSNDEITLVGLLITNHTSQDIQTIMDLSVRGRHNLQRQVESKLKGLRDD